MKILLQCRLSFNNIFWGLYNDSLEGSTKSILYSLLNKHVHDFALCRFHEFQ